jgi:hypothetical protein
MITIPKYSWWVLGSIAVVVFIYGILSERNTAQRSTTSDAMLVIKEKDVDIGNVQRAIRYVTHMFFTTQAMRR